MKYGAITTESELLENLATHCIPSSVFQAGVNDYDQFLAERRKLMA
jgi:hypothetical protein